NSETSCCALRSAVGLGKVSVTVFPATRRVRRNCGSCPGSLRLAQWQEGLPQRRVTAVIEPGRRSLKPRNSSRSLDLWVSKVARSSGIQGLLSVAYLVCTYIDAQNYATKMRTRQNGPSRSRAPTTLLISFFFAAVLSCSC